MAHCYNVRLVASQNDPWAGHYRDQFDPPSVCSTNASLPGSCTWTNNNTAPPPPCCECGEGLASSKCVWNVSEWNRDLAPLAPLVRNSSATPQFMGSIVRNAVRGPLVVNLELLIVQVYCRGLANVKIRLVAVHS
jgi:hypothetical protein